MIDNKTFKKALNQLLLSNYSFKKVANVWQKQIGKYWVQINLQKSNFPNSYYTNLKIVHNDNIIRNTKNEIISKMRRIGRIGDSSTATELDDLLDYDDAFTKLSTVFKNQFISLEQELQKEPNWDKLKKERTIFI